MKSSLYPSVAFGEWGLCPSLLTFIRHGESESNATTKRKNRDLVYKQFLAAYKSDWQSLETRTLAFAVKQKFFAGMGQNDAMLTEEGKKQAKETGARLREEGLLDVPDAVFFSKAARTRETFECMAQGWPELGSAILMPPDNRLREQEHGLITIYSDLRVMFAICPEQRQLHDAEGEYFYKFPNGENVPDAELRAGLWLEDIRRRFAGRHVMVFSHFRTIFAIRMLLEGLSPQEFIRINKEDGPINCGVTVYRKEPARGKSGKLVLECYNKKLYD